MNYKIDFISKAGHRYQIRIYDGSTFSESSATTLLGGAQPIVTNEEDSKDIWTPVRYSTGYINIVTSDTNLRNKLMPQKPDSIRVTLVRYTGSSASAVWHGYISQESYSQPWAAMPQELEIPIISRLGMVCKQQLSTGNGGILSVGQWLGRLAGNVYGRVLISDSELLYNGTTDFNGATVESPTALKCAFSEGIFKTPIPLTGRLDPYNTESGLWYGGTNEDIAKTLSALFRWVFYERGEYLVCADPATPSAQYMSIPTADLATSYPRYSYVSRSSLVLGEDVHVCNDSGTTDTVMPYGAISVTPKTGGYPASIIKPMEDEFMLFSGVPVINGGESRPDTTTWQSWGDYGTVIRSQRMLDNPEYRSYQYYAQDYEQYPGGTAWPLDCSLIYANAFPAVILGNSSLLAGPWFGGGEIVSTLVYQTTGGSRPQIGESIRYTSIILGRVFKSASSYLPAITLRSCLSHTLSSSTKKLKPMCLCISCAVTVGETINQMAVDQSIPNGRDISIYASIKCGSQYIGPSVKGDFGMQYKLQDSIYYQRMRTKDDNRINEYYNLYMNVVDGPIEITLYTPSSTTTAVSDPIYIRLDNFDVSISEEQTPVSELYPQYVDRGPRKTQLALKNSNGSASLSLNPEIGEAESPQALFAFNSRTPATKIGILVGDSDGAPQLYKRTFEWLCRYYNSSTTIHTISVTAANLSCFDNPFILNMPYSFMPLARTVDWREDEFTLKLIQIK